MGNTKTDKKKAWKMRKKLQGDASADNSPSRRHHSHQSLQRVQAARSLPRQLFTATIHATRRVARWIEARILKHQGPCTLFFSFSRLDAFRRIPSFFLAAVVEVVQDYVPKSRGPDNRLHPIREEIKRIRYILEKQLHVSLLPRDGPVKLVDNDDSLLVHRHDLLDPASQSMDRLTRTAMEILLASLFRYSPFLLSNPRTHLFFMQHLRQHPHPVKKDKTLTPEHLASIKELFALMQHLFPDVPSIGYPRFKDLVGDVHRSLTEHETGHFGTWFRSQDHAFLTGDTRDKTMGPWARELLSLIRLYILPPLALHYYVEHRDYFRRAIEFVF